MTYTARDKKEYYRASNAYVYGASLTKEPITSVFQISTHTALYFRAAFKASAITVTAGITVLLQTRLNSNHAWVDSKSFTPTTTAENEFKLLPEVAGDQTYLPLACQGRFVVTTGVGDTVTLEHVIVTLCE